MTSSAAVESTELVRAARERDELDVSAYARVVFAVWTGLVLATSVGALAIHGGPAFSLWRVTLFAVLYAAVSRVEFEVGVGSAIPTQLVLVPMLFALPLGVVPLTVAAGFLLRTIGQHPWPLRHPARALPLLASAAHALGPVFVLALFDGLPLRWSAWPVYVAALVAQFAFDFAHSAISGRAHRLDIRTVAGFVSMVYGVDAALAPIGLAVAFATRQHVWLALLGLPLVVLLRLFSGERQHRLDHAIELSDAYRGTAFLLGDVVEADDTYTGLHSRHVVDLVVAVADDLGLSSSERRDAEFTALLHDVGKIRIPGEIINKPGPLDPDERKLMETHTIIGQELLEQVGGLLGHVGRLVRSCHERWDGGGYPDALAGEEIPLIARIVCACDAFSAMTTDRSYRKALTHEDALAELERCAGTHFDPEVVASIVKVDERTSRAAA